MGSGRIDRDSYTSYSRSFGRSVDSSGRINGQDFLSKKLDKLLDPLEFEIRECCNNEEHPNTVPVILALDVTGSMGKACKETAATIGKIMTNLYEKIKDVEFCIMGIGDVECDSAPIQMSQFESDIRVLSSLDKIYREGNGGGNGYESYSAAWFMGLYHTRLDCFDKQGRKGIIITMGDEPLNPYLPSDSMARFVKGNQGLEGLEVNTKDLYKLASKKFDIYHIAVDDRNDSYSWYRSGIKSSFGKLLGDRFLVSSIDGLAGAIENCITDSVNSQGMTSSVLPENTPTSSEISW